jgi:hypothetical protein
MRVRRDDEPWRILTRDGLYAPEVQATALGTDCQGRSASGHASGHMGCGPGRSLFQEERYAKCAQLNSEFHESGKIMGKSHVECGQKEVRLTDASR